MHDSFNLAWKLNLVTRGLASPSLLHTYEDERQKIAHDLINFDVEHCKAFSEGEAALAKNFDDNIRFIAGVGAEYSPSMLTSAISSASSLQPGMLQLPGKVTRYIDANPVDIQLDIPLLGQFKIYIFAPDIGLTRDALGSMCQQFETSLAKITTLANRSYEKHPRGESPSTEYQQAQRYTAVSNAFTFAMVTKSSQLSFEISELPEMLQKSRWTLYLDNCQSPDCTEKWFGNLEREKVGVAIVRPDGYIGAIDTWHWAQVETTGRWLEDYFSFMV
jgi:phenol 2-monooxygenase